MKHTAEGSFLHWIISHKNSSLSICITIVLYIAGFIYYHFEQIENTWASKWFPALCFGAHLLVILILFGFTYLVKPLTSKKYKGISKAVKDFHKALLFLWIVWAALYCVLTYQAIYNIQIHDAIVREAKSMESNIQNPLSSAINQNIEKERKDEVITSLKEYLSYGKTKNVEAARKDMNTISEIVEFVKKYPGYMNADLVNTLKSSVEYFEKHKDESMSKALEILLNFINNLQSVAMILLFWVLAFPRKLKEIYLIAIVCLVATAAFATVDIRFAGSMGILVGIFGGLTMALWVGRLDSKFLGAHFLITLALYAYAILQVAWFAYQYEDEKILIITSLALMFKIVVYFVCSWILVEGRLLYFCAEMRLLHGEAKENEGIPMQGEITVAKRRKAFLDDVKKSKNLERIRTRPEVLLDK